MPPEAAKDKKESGRFGKKESLANLKTAKIMKAIVTGLLRAMQDQRDLMSCCIDVLIGRAEDNVYT